MPDSRESAQSAEYMELRGAVKDADCSKVEVPGGISMERGCCDRYEAENESVTQFKCGVCEYHMSLKDLATGDNFQEPLSNDDTSTPSFPAYKNTGLKGTHAKTPFRPQQIRIKSAPLAAAIARARRPGSHKNG